MSPKFEQFEEVPAHVFPAAALVFLFWDLRLKFSPDHHCWGSDACCVADVSSHSLLADLQEVPVGLFLGTSTILADSHKSCPNGSGGAQKIPIALCVSSV